MNTIESNKLIAEFMGVVNIIDKYFEDEKGNYTDVKEGVHYNHIITLNYNNSFNRLMPVVHKIKQLGESENVYSVEFEKLKLTAPIERIYKVVIEFIQWYNKLGRKLP